MFINKLFQSLVSSAFSAYEKSLLQFFPDVIPYDYKDQSAFLQDWNKLLQHANNDGYFYVDEHVIKPVSRWRNGWERFKANFGFTNHCSKERVEMALQKLGYYGYVNNFFDQANHLQSLPSFLPQKFSDILYQPKTKQNLALLQTCLIESYQLRAINLQPTFWTRLFPNQDFHFPYPQGINFLFGDSIIYAANLAQQTNINFKELRKDLTFESLKILASLQPQDSGFIEKHFNTLYDHLTCDRKTLSDIQECFSNNPELRLAMAKQLMVEASKVLNAGNTWWAYVPFQGKKLDWNSWYNFAEPAERFDPTILQKHKIQFIECSLFKGKFGKAFELILSLKDIDQQFKLICDWKLEPLLEEHKDTEVAKRLAKKYIQDSQSYLCMNRKYYLDKADKLASWTIDPVTYFDFYMEESRYEKAYEIFSKAEKGMKFNAKNIEKLAKLYASVGETLYDAGLKFRGKDDESTYTFYKKSLNAKKIALQLCPTNTDFQHNVSVHRRLIAQLLASTSSLFSPSPADRLDKAIAKFRKCDDFSDKFLVLEYTKALEARINLLIEECLLPKGSDYEINAPSEHKQNCAEKTTKLRGYLEEYLKLVDKKKDPELAAKLHFMLGDLIWFFELGDYKKHFQEAVKFAPQNPFYATANLDSNKSDLEKAWELFPEHVNPKRYYDWKEERWSPDKIKSSDLDIYSCKTENKSVFNIW